MSILSEMLKRYTDALDAGNFETVGAILEVAMYDSELSRVIGCWHSEHDVCLPIDREKLEKAVRDALEKGRDGE